MKKRMISLFLSTVMIFSFVKAPLSVKAVDEELTGAEAVLKSIENVSPTISSDGTRIILPESSNDDYDVKLYGSSNESVISMDGKIYKPLEDMTVKVMYQVVNKNDPEDKALDNWKEVSVSIPGQYTNEEGDNARPDVVPAIREWKGYQGNFNLSSESRIVISDVSLKETADSIAYYFKEMLGRDINIVEGTPNNGDIYLSLTDKSELGEEGYEVEIGDIINVEAYKAKGVLYAGTTLTQILYQDKNHEIIPKGLIRDYPQYEVRSCMIDVARFYMPLDYLQEVTKYMAYFKLNEIHVHINDNGGEQSAAFRVESKKYPEINSNLNPDEVYSQEDYKNYQKEVAKYGIDVVTEIDTPAHSGFVGLYDSSLLLDGYHIDLSNEKSIEFIKSLLDEFLDGDDPVFQGKKFNIGTDEYNKSYSELVRGYMDELINYVNGKGLETRMWASLGANGFSGTTPVSNDVTAHYWSPSWASYDEMIDAGYKCINNADGVLYTVPGAGYYHDYLDISNLYNTWEANKLSSSYTLPTSNPLMMGSEAACWYDMKTGMSQFDNFDRIRDQIMLMSEKNWFGEKQKNQTGQEFLERIAKVDQYAPGSNPARYVDSKTETVVSYDFENVDETTVIDNSGNEYNGELNGLKVVEDNNSNVLQLDGQGYLSLPFNSIGFPYSISFDLYLDKDVEKNSVLFNGNDGTMYLNYDGTGKIGYERKGYSYILDYELDEGLWENIMITCNNKDARLYIDGVYVASGEYYNVSAAKQESSTFILPTSEVGKGVKGKIDNIQLLNKCMSYEEIAGLDIIDYSNQALNKPVKVSGLEVDDGRFTGEMAVDGDLSTRVSFERKDDAWFMVDLEDIYLVDKIEIVWNEKPNKYEIYLSEDGENWTKVYEDLACVGQSAGTDTIVLDEVMKARYVKYQQLEMFNCDFGEYSGNFSEFRVWTMGNKTTTILEKAKDLLSKTPVNENNKVFLNRFSDNIKLIENTILNRSIEEIAAAYKQLNKQIEMIESGQTTCEEVDISELKDLLTTDIDLSLYTDDSKNKYESECRIALNTLMDINSSQSKIDLAVKKIKAAKEGLVIRPIVTITSNRSIYQNNYLENLIDGSVDTIAWLEHNQEIGDYIQFRFREPIKLSKVQVISTGAGGDIIGNADFQVSSDGSSWVTVGKLTSLEDQTINFDETSAKYARILLTSAKENWLKINEVIFNDKYFVDTANLENELNNAFDEEKYTIDSYKAYLKAVEEAKNILEKENKTQEEVDNALTRLKEAEGNLQYRIADFSELEDLINKVEEMDLSKYTENSVNDLNKSLNSAKTALENKDNITEAEYNQVIKDLKDSIDKLVLTIEGVDTSELEKELDKKYDEKLYTKYSYRAYEEAVKAGKDVLLNKNRTQEEVDDAVATLKRRVSNLQEKDYTNLALEKPVEVSGLEVDDGRFTGEMAVDGDLSTRVSLERKDDSWLKVDLKDSYLVDKIEIVWREKPNKYEIYLSEDGETWTKVYEDLECVGQSEGTDTIVLDEAVKARYVKYQQVEMFNDNVYGSGKYSGSFYEINVYAENSIYKAELEYLISNIKLMDLSKYTEDSVNALNTSLESANTVLNDDDATQNQVDEALANLTAAKEGLALKANKTLLTQTIAQADTLVSEGALEGVNTIVVENFNKALENAKEVEANENATQEEVNDAWMNLAQAIQMLDFKTDKTELNALIAECEALDLNKYEDEGKEEFQAALAHAKEISEREDVLTEESIKEAIDRLTAAKEALVEKPEIDTSLLEYLYNTVKDTDLTKYIADGQDEFKAALENAKNVLENPESQEQVDEAVRRLNNAYTNLRLKASEDTLRKLQSFVTEAENIDESLYSAETLAMIQEVKNEANMALADPNLTEDSAEKLLVKVEKAKVAIANPDGGNNTENPENPENPNSPEDPNNPNNQGNSGETNNTGNGDSGNNNNQGNVNGSNNEGKGNAVSTGDYSKIGLLSITLLVSLAGVTIFIGKKKKVN